jgi:DNA polymerase-3 subunit epsilon
MKLLYLDCETTGLDPKKNAPIQISGIITTPKHPNQEFNIHLRPHPTAEIDPAALKCNNLTAEALHDPARLEPVDAYKKLKSIFLTHIDRYNREDKFYLVGQNVHFDYGFLFELWNRQGDNYLGSFIHYHKIDLIAITAAMRLSGHLPKDKVPNFKLETLAGYFGLGAQTHDAMDDIRMTRDVFQRYVNILSRCRIDPDLDSCGTSQHLSGESSRISHEPETSSS